MGRSYRYVGPDEIADRIAGSPMGATIGSAGDVLRWMKDTDQARDRSGCVTATFVVDESGMLRLADRHSEHVACAGGRCVLAAGEITFKVRSGQVDVEEVTNQSTGYCPEPESWSAVAVALQSAGLPSPSGYTAEFAFRRCPTCASINLIKDMVFECAVCGRDLPAEWNLAPA